MSYVMAVFILVPVIAPSLGSLVLSVTSWEATFWVLVACAVAAGVWATRLPESLPPSRRIAAATRGGWRRRCGPSSRAATPWASRSPRRPRSRLFASYLATSELFIGDVFGLSAWFPLIFGGTALCMGLGMLANPRLLDRYGLRRWLRLVLGGYVAATLLLATIALLTGGQPPFWLFLAGLLPVLLAQGFVTPNLNSAAMMPMGHIAGTAAAVIGSISTLGGALIGALIDRAFDGTVLPFAIAGAVLVGSSATRPTAGPTRPGNAPPTVSWASRRTRARQPRWSRAAGRMRHGGARPRIGAPGRSALPQQLCRSRRWPRLDCPAVAGPATDPVRLSPCRALRVIPGGPRTSGEGCRPSIHARQGPQAGCRMPPVRLTRRSHRT